MIREFGKKNHKSQTELRKRKIFALAICGCLVATGGLLSLIEIQGAVIATGVTITKTKNKRIQSLEGGRVARILVKEGERVVQGQALVHFDATSEQKTLNSVSQQIDFLAAMAARLNSEVSLGNKVEKTPLLEGRLSSNTRLIEEVNRQEDILRARLEGVMLERARLEEGIKLLKADIEGLEVQKVSAQTQLESSQRNLDRKRTLRQKGTSTDAHVDEALAIVAENQRKLGELQSQVAQRKISISETQIKVEGLSRKFSETALVALADQRQKIAELIEREAALEARVDALTLKSPQKGTVHRLEVNAIGETVPANAVVMEIVPNSEDLLIEARIRTLDIDQVYEGREANFQISSFDQKFLPQLSGEVIFVAADASQPDQNSEPVFIARIRPYEGEFDKLGDLKPVPGMPVNAFITTTKASILAIVAKPLIDIVKRSLRE